MADLNYTARVDVTQAEASLSRLQKSVAGVSDTFIRLKTTLATISLGAIIGQSLQFADAISDLSDVSEIAIGNIIGFGKAVAASGGTADGAQKAILKLVNSIGEAADGSLSLQNAFADVGVTLNDLRTTSNEDILKKTIDGLDKMENSAKRSVLVTQLLGKEFRNVATGELGAAYAAATAESAKYADAIAKGAAAQQNIDKTLSDLKIGLLEAIKPFTELASEINIGIEAFKRFGQALIAVGVVLGGAFLFTKIIAGIRALWAAITVVSTAIGELIGLGRNLINGFSAIWRATEGAGGAFSRILLAIQAVGAAISELLAPAFAVLKPLVIPILASIAAAWGSIQDSTTAAIAKAREYADALTFGVFGLTKKEGPKGTQADVRRVDNAIEAQSKKDVTVLREVTDALAKKRQEIQKASDAFKRQNNEIIDNINLEKSFIGKTEDYIEVQKAVEEVQKRAANESQKLRDAKAALSKDEQGLAGVYDQQIAKIVQTAQVDADRIAKSVEGLQGLRLVEKGRLQDIENTTKAIESQISRQQALGDIIRGANQQAAEVRGATPTSQLTGLSSIQRQIVEIQDSARKAAIEAARSFAANFEDNGDGLTPESAQELADGLDQIAESYKRLADAQISVSQANYETSRTFTTGWADAFAEYAESASNSAKQAQMYFETFTGGMEDAMVNFAKTGKLSFKDLANSIIADLIRIQTRKMIVSAMSGGLGGIVSGIGSLFGFAAGGATDTSPMIVGERGPELFIPNSAGRIIPNNQLGNNQPQQMITNVTYSIQAVDASSFRQLVARDPQFIYSVTEKGRRSVPTRR